MNKNTLIKLGLGIVVLLFVGGLFISNGEKSSTPKSVRVGMISILSGEYSSVGENVRNGAMLAAEQYNAKHPDSKIELIIEDDGFDPKKALSAYQKLTSINKIDALINVSTASIGGIYDLVTKTDMPVIQGGEQHIEPTKDNVFQIMPGNIELEEKLGAYLKEKGYKNPALVYTNYDAMIRFKKALVSGYGPGISEFALGADDKDFATHVLKVSQINPDVVIMLTFPQQGAQFIKEYVSIKGKVPQLAFDTNAQSGIADYQRILNGAQVLNGSIIAIVSSNISQEFKTAYKNRFGTEAGFWTDLGYDSLNLLVETHNKDGKKWIKNVNDASIVGVNGKIEFDEVGVRKPEVSIVRISGGQIPVSK